MPGFTDIQIGIDPNIFESGGLTLSWHGMLTFIAVAFAVVFIAWWGRRNGILPDTVYSVAVWAIIGGIIGSRAFHVADLWRDIYWDNPERIIQVWEGGITIYGAILGGFVSGAAYMIIRNHPKFLDLWGKYFNNRWVGQPHRADLPSVGRLADVAVPGILIAMAIGRVGDVINGEHFAELSSLPWAVVYTHIDTVLLYASGGAPAELRSLATTVTPATHPAVIYEMLLDLAVLGVVLWFRPRLRPDGMLFALYLGLYSLGRFFISFQRFDKEWIGPLNEAQLIALVVLIIVVPLLTYKAQLVRVVRPGSTPPAQRKVDR